MANAMVGDPSLSLFYSLDPSQFHITTHLPPPPFLSRPAEKSTRMRSQVDLNTHSSSSSALHLYIPQSPESPSRLSLSESPSSMTTKRGRGRKRDDTLPYNRARDVQRAFRARRAAHLESLEERVLDLEAENTELRSLLSLPPSSRPALGKGPTGRGKALIGDSLQDSCMRSSEGADAGRSKDNRHGSPSNTSSSHSSSPASVISPMITTPWNNTWEPHHGELEEHVDGASGAASSAVSSIDLDIPAKLQQQSQYLSGYYGDRSGNAHAQNMHEATPPYSDISSQSSTNTSPSFPLRDLHSHPRHGVQYQSHSQLPLHRFTSQQQHSNEAISVQLHHQVYPQHNDYSFPYPTPVTKQEGQDGMSILPSTLSMTSTSTQLPCTYARHRSGNDPSIPRDFPLSSAFSHPSAMQRQNEMPMRLSSPSVQNNAGIHPHHQYPHRV